MGLNGADQLKVEILDLASMYEGDSNRVSPELSLNALASPAGASSRGIGFSALASPAGATSRAIGFKVGALAKERLRLLGELFQANPNIVNQSACYVFPDHIKSRFTLEGDKSDKALYEATHPL